MIVLVIALLAPCADGPPSAKAALDRLVGIWVPVGKTFDGEVLDQEGDEVAFTRREMYGDGQLVFRYELDPSRNPKQIDLTAGDKQIPGIYKLDGDTLTICLTLPDDDGNLGERPKRFSAGKGERTGLLVFRRFKPRE
jgi:uncharacterized protein (TIGR03067 family)